MKNQPSSLLRMTASAVIFGTIGLFRRALPVSSAALACFRGLCGAAFLTLFARAKGAFSAQRPCRKKLLLTVLAGCAMGLNWILLFEAYNYTTVATATLCYYMQPTIVTLLSPVLFREKLGPRKLLCAAVSLAGMFLVSGAGTAGNTGSARGILLGLGAAALYAFVVILNKFTPGIDVYRKTVTELLSAALVLLPYLLVNGNTGFSSLTPGSAALLAVVGIVHTGIAYALYFGSMDGLRAQTIAVVSYLDPIVALVLSALFLKEPMSAASVLGAVLILCAALFGELTGAKED